MAAEAPKWSLEIHHIDVGGGEPGAGDSTLIVAKNDAKVPVVRSVLIDGGKKGAGRKTVSPYVKKILNDSKSLDVIVVTHYDLDHFGGISDILKQANRNNDSFYANTIVFDQGMPFNEINENNYLEYIQAVGSRRTTGLVASDGGQFETDTESKNTLKSYFDEMSLTQQALYKKLHPPINSKKAFHPSVLLRQEIMWRDAGVPLHAPSITCIAANQYALNANGEVEYSPASLLKDDARNPKSLAFIVEFNKFRYYIGGDLISAQEDILCQYLNPNNTLTGRVQAVKLSHHGSAYSSSKIFLNRLKPKATFISCGLFNSYPHPSISLLERLNDCASKGYKSSDPAENNSIKKSKPAKSDEDMDMSLSRVAWNLESCYLTGYPKYNDTSLGQVVADAKLEDNDPYIVAGTYAIDNNAVLPYTPGHIVVNVSQVGSLLDPKDYRSPDEDPVFTVTYKSYSDKGKKGKKAYDENTGSH